MLRITSPEAQEACLEYISKHTDFSGYVNYFPGLTAEPSDTHDICRWVLKIWDAEKPDIPGRYHADYYGTARFRRFEDWCQGLPSVLDTCYYYNRSAIDDLIALLGKPNDEELRRFVWMRDESKAEEALSKLIFNTLEEYSRW